MIEKLIGSYAQKENEAIQKSIEARKHLLPETVHIERNVSFDIDEKRSGKINVYYPENHGKLPVIINIHGGGLVCGIMEQNDLMCANIAAENYLVFAVEYPLMPEARVAEMYQVIAAGLNYISDTLEKYNGDRNNVFWSGDSAGAYLITNVAILKENAAMREAFGVPEIKLGVKALGLISGMFYTNKKDKIGLTLTKLMFGKGYKNTKLYEFTNLERREMIECLPPCFFVSSHNDMLKKHTLCFERAFKKTGKSSQLVYFPKNKKLVHAFVALYPEYEESKFALAEMLKFFEFIGNLA